MEEFNRLRKNTLIQKLKDLKPGIYKLISLRKISTKYGDCAVVKICVENEEIEYFLKKQHAIISENAIRDINSSDYLFNYRGMIDGKYEYEIQEL